MESSDFMPMSLDTFQNVNSYAAAKSGGNLTVEEVEDLGYTVKDDNDFGLDFTDYLNLMVQQLQNQTIDNTADTSDMLNQMVQMSVVQMMNTVQTGLENLTAATTMSYAASLVGKTVTVGVYNEEGKIEEVVGTVQGTGTYENVPVIFIDDEMYPLNSIMAVGTLPEIPEEGEGGEGGEGGETGGTGGTEGGDQETPEV
ncbi:flagellar hook capping FlgD N-terminal domain-containing protein [uncultured Flavonifractor sp.]|uniref:flagellar hook capping FlgD N-terminal domain-containing protein n=1 Tax=uncultured Flavonifractor sp. TaxID=1193534 RepID=UPI00262A3273|nr:flagellar hook capping FlgD N-terminal domain-containing protein [uncultured Flavonifractor sp.]